MTWGKTELWMVRNRINQSNLSKHVQMGWEVGDGLWVQGEHAMPQKCDLSGDRIYICKNSDLLHQKLDTFQFIIDRH